MGPSQPSSAAVGVSEHPITGSQSPSCSTPHLTSQRNLHGLEYSAGNGASAGSIHDDCPGAGSSGCPVHTGTDQTLLCWSFRCLTDLAMRGHSCVPQPCTLTLFSCTLVFGSVSHCLGHVLERNFGRKPKSSGPALQRSPFFMERLLWRPVLSQKCPLPVTA